MKSLIYLLLYNIVPFTFVESRKIYSDLAKFCSTNGFFYVSLTTTNDEKLLHKEAEKAFIKLEKYTGAWNGNHTFLIWN